MNDKSLVATVRSNIGRANLPMWYRPICRHATVLVLTINALKPESLDELG